MTRRALSLFIILFFALWTLAWLIHQGIVFQLHWWASDASAPNLIYWVVMKFVVWVLYPWLWWRRRVPNVRDFIGLSPTTLTRGYRWGTIATVVWVAMLFGSTLVLKQKFVGITDWAMYTYIITLTPIFEEIMFRGFIVGGLLALKLDGKIVNVITTVLFLLIHFVGWVFQGVFIHNLASTAWVSIALFSLVAGFIRIHSGSLRASILLHMGNNAFGGLVG